MFGSPSGAPPRRFRPRPARTDWSPGALRRKRDPASVRRPHRVPVHAGIECQARQRSSRQAPDPDVVLLVAHVERHLRPVWRDPRIQIRPRRSGDGFLAAVPIDPDQRSGLRQRRCPDHMNKRPLVGHAVLRRAGVRSRRQRALKAGEQRHRAARDLETLEIEAAAQTARRRARRSDVRWERIARRCRLCHSTFRSPDVERLDDDLGRVPARVARPAGQREEHPLSPGSICGPWACSPFSVATSSSGVPPFADTRMMPSGWPKTIVLSGAPTRAKRIGRLAQRHRRAAGDRESFATAGPHRTQPIAHQARRTDWSARLRFPESRFAFEAVHRSADTIRRLALYTKWRPSGETATTVLPVLRNVWFGAQRMDEASGRRRLHGRRRLQDPHGGADDDRRERNRSAEPRKQPSG